MKKTARSVAFATILIPLILSANSTTIKFDTALTNGTEWSFNDKVGNNNSGYYLLQDAEVATPQFGFNITSVEIRVTTTASCNRNLIIRPGDNASSDSDCAFNTIPTGTTTNLVATWNAASPIRSFTINSTVGGKGYLYIKSAVISGVPLIEPPTNLQSDEIKGTRSNLSWENPENAVSNKIEVAEVAWHEESGDKVIRHTFNEFSNKGDTKDKTENIVEKYPDLSDSILLCYPTNSAGQIQISQESNKGILVHKGLDSYYKMSLSLRLRRYQGDNDSMSVQWIASNGSTNDLKTVSLSDNFTTEVIALSDVDPDAPLVLNALGNKTKHRIIIDEMSFIRDYSPASVSTNLVKTVFPTGSTTYCARGLSPWTEYIAKITAFDEDGNESEPSEPISFMTNGAELPLVIKLQ